MFSGYGRPGQGSQGGGTDLAEGRCVPWPAGILSDGLGLSPFSYDSTYTCCDGYRGGGVDYGILYDMLVQGVCFGISKLWKAWAWRGGDVIRWKVTEGDGR